MIPILHDTMDLTVHPNEFTIDEIPTHVKNRKFDGRDIPFDTGLMDKILKTTDKDGIPDFKKLDEIQKDRPGITEDGAEFLKFLDIAKSYAIDNISYETEGGSKNGFKATQLLMNVKPDKRKFTPLVYHVGKTTKPEFLTYQAENKGDIYAAIGLGNPPYMKGLASWPVSFKLKSYC
jgi:hypothetical protein